MNQSTEKTDRNPRRRRLAWLFGLWAMSVWLLWSIWPVQPRLVLRNSDDVEVVGITPDGSELVAFTRRAFVNKGNIVSSDGTQPDFDAAPSGPIQFWNLRTGQHRTLCIPGQSCSGSMEMCGWDEKRRMLEPDGWQTSRIRFPFHGNWFQFGCHITRSQQDLWGHQVPWENRDTLILNMETGVARRPPQRDGFTSYIDLSPTGRWYVEATREDGTERYWVRLIETASEREVLAFEGVGRIDDACFSKDDYYFACSTANNEDDKDASTRIWKLDDGQQVRVIEQNIRFMSFSSDHCFLAAVISDRDDSHIPCRLKEILVFDVRSGAVAYRSVPKLENRDLDFGSKLEFIDNDTWLIYHGLYNLYEGDTPVHARLNLRLAWNLRTGESVTYSDEHGADMYDPNISENSILPDKTPSRFRYSKRDDGSDEQLFKITTGRPVFRMPPDSESILLSREGRTLLIHEYKQSHVYNLLTSLQSRGLSVPNIAWSLVPETGNNWKVIDIPSGRTITTMRPHESICWLSPDERTLVAHEGVIDAAGNPTPTDLTVWDFPPRRPLLQPLLTSMLVPFLFLLWLLWRRRVSKKPTMGHTSSAVGAVQGL